MAAAVVIEEILRRHGIDATAALLPRQGNGAYAWAAGAVIVKIARSGCSGETACETVAAPIARAAGVRTPALLASAHDGELAYSIWERVEGEPLAERADAVAWREVGGQLAALHTVARCDDPLGVLHTRNKRDARPYLHALAPALAQRFARWLDRLESVPAAAPRLLHYDVHGLNVLCAPAGVTLIDWGDAGWGDPASELGSVPMRYVPEVLAGYEERASLGPAAEARILRAVLGHAVRKLAERGRTHPLDQLLAFVERGAPERWREWIVDQ